MGNNNITDKATEVLFGYKFEDSNSRKRNQELDKCKKENKGKDLSREWTYQEVWDEVLYSGNVLPKKLTKEHRVVIVDADMLVYRTSAAVETRSVKTVVDGVAVEFPTRTLLKEYCIDVDVDYKDLMVTDHHENEHISGCISTLKKSVRNIYRELDATHVVFLLGGTGNFRLDLPLPTQYKAARKEIRRPDYLKDCRDFLNRHYDTFVVSGCEADDATQSLSEHIINNTDAWGVGYSVDKDFRTAMKQNRYYNPVTKELVELAGGLGSISLHKGKIVGDGLHFLMYQCFSGDPSDNFSPKQFFNTRFGDKSYYNHFKDCTSEKDLLETWVSKWKELLPESIEYIDWKGSKQVHTWQTLADLYMRCPMMLMHPSDTTTFTSLLERYGVEYEENNHLITANSKEVVSE